jgi:hypothetical protein
MDALARTRRDAPMRTAKPCGPDSPTLESSLAGRFARRWWLRSPVRQGEHGAAVKTIVQGRPALLRFTCGPTPVLFVARGPRVQSAPGFPCAL